MTKLHGGGKFGDENYAMSGGLHGVGAAVTNALSKLLTVRVCREGTKYEQSFSCGIPSADLFVLGQTDEPNGTEVCFSPDEEMFEHADEECGMEFDFDWISSRLKTASYLNKGLKLSLCDKKTGQVVHFFSENGITDIVIEGINNTEKLISTVPFYFSEKARIKMKNNYINAKSSKILVLFRLLEASSVYLLRFCAPFLKFLFSLLPQTSSNFFFGHPEPFFKTKNM